MIIMTFSQMLRESMYQSEIVHAFRFKTIGNEQPVSGCIKQEGGSGSSPWINLGGRRWFWNEKYYRNYNCKYWQKDKKLCYVLCR